jgi:hypothetical protein
MDNIFDVKKTSNEINIKIIKNLKIEDKEKGEFFDELCQKIIKLSREMKTYIKKIENFKIENNKFNGKAYIT